MNLSIHDQAILTCRRLLSQINRDPATPTYGCFDRRFWAWKLVDFPEATFQRNISALIWFAYQQKDKTSKKFTEIVRSGLQYALKIQHKDGSFDQAYPHEHSYGATAFLLPDLISSYKYISSEIDHNESGYIANRLKRSADYLCKSNEQHGFISNHLAGAALGLIQSWHLFDDEVYKNRSQQIVRTIIQNQSPEGWFFEYSGADPGYQTLCMYYLAQVYKSNPSDSLRSSLDKSLDFLRYFIHPDGSFGGEYGSRRTEIYYPGGIALLAKEFPVAAEMHTFMKESIKKGQTVTLMDIDIGNTAPLLSNYILANSVEIKNVKSNSLPFQQNDCEKHFKMAGIAIKGTQKYYAVLGASNGGVLKVFNKKIKKQIFNDCGLLGKTKQGALFSNQFTNPENSLYWNKNIVKTTSTFNFLSGQSPTPFNYILLRLANLTVMRFKTLNEYVKKMLVKFLLQSKSPIPIKRSQKIEFDIDRITITERIIKNGHVEIEEIVKGKKFSTIHMASARYFTPPQLINDDLIYMDCDLLEKTGEIKQSITIDLNEKNQVQL